MRYLDRVAEPGVTLTTREAQRLGIHGIKVSELPICSTRLEGKPITLEYQRVARSWTHQTFVPDYIIRIGKVNVLLDAKYYLYSDEDQAVRDMLTYLGAFLWPEQGPESQLAVRHAVLFFPKHGSDFPYEVSPSDGYTFSIRRLRLVSDPTRREDNAKSLDAMWTFIRNLSHSS